MRTIDKKLKDILSTKNGMIQSQIIILNDLSIKLSREKDPKIKEEIRADIETISLATNSIKEIDKQKVVK